MIVGLGVEGVREVEGGESEEGRECEELKKVEGPNSIFKMVASI